MGPMTYDDDQDELSGYGQPQWQQLPLAYPDQPAQWQQGPRQLPDQQDQWQSLLPPEYSASDDLTWARLRAGRSSIEDDVRKGVLAEDLGQDLLQQVDGMLLPLRQKKEAARQYGKQQAVQQIMEDQGLQRGIQQVDAEHRAQQFPGTVSAFTDLTRPFGFQTAFFYPDSKGNLKQVEFPEPPEQPAATENDYQATAAPEAPEPSAATASPEEPEQPAAPPLALGIAKPSESAVPAAIGKPRRSGAAPGQYAWWDPDWNPEITQRYQAPDGQMVWDQAGKFQATRSQREVQQAWKTREPIDRETYQRALRDRIAQEEGVSRDYSITQADTVALWHQAERSTGGRAGPQRNRAIETLHRQLVGMKKDQLNDLRDAELRSNQKQEIMALQSAENQRKEGARLDAAKELLEERQAFTKEGLQGLKPASIITLATNVESGMRAEKRQAIQAGLDKQEMEPWMTNPALEEVEATRRLQALAKRVYGMLGAKGEDFAPLTPAQREALDQEERQKGPGPWKAGYKETDERSAAPSPSVRAPVAGAAPVHVLNAQAKQLRAFQQGGPAPAPAGAAASAIQQGTKPAAAPRPPSKNPPGILSPGTTGVM